MTLRGFMAYPSTGARKTGTSSSLTHRRVIVAQTVYLGYVYAGGKKRRRERRRERCIVSGVTLGSETTDAGAVTFARFDRAHGPLSSSPSSSSPSGATPAR